jgi:hypothetical protein
VSSIDYQFDDIQESFWAFSVIWSKRLDIEKNANTHLTGCQRLANRIQRHENYKLTHFLKMRSPFPPSPLQILSQSNMHQFSHASPLGLPAVERVSGVLHQKRDRLIQVETPQV